MWTNEDQAAYLDGINDVQAAHRAVALLQDEAAEILAQWRAKRSEARAAIEAHRAKLNAHLDEHRRMLRETAHPIANPGEAPIAADGAIPIRAPHSVGIFRLYSSAPPGKCPCPPQAIETKADWAGAWTNLPDGWHANPAAAKKSRERETDILWYSEAVAYRQLDGDIQFKHWRKCALYDVA